MICCESLDKKLNLSCINHQNNCPDSPFHYSPKTREWSIKLGEFWKYDSWECLGMQFCPFCGYKFPESLRNKYFEELEVLGIDHWMEPEKVPEEYKSDKWWNK